ncbi:MAG: threonine/serine exporter family protein [Bifidobacteriaceae bacterium]|nr:threonine/serine exporter family protein [Bifidobacteriaceae bacterium]
MPSQLSALEIEEIKQDLDKPVQEAGLSAKTSIIMRVGKLDLAAGTGSFRVKEMMTRIASALHVRIRTDVNLTNIEAICTDGKSRIADVADLPTVGVNTERIWLLEHFADWIHDNLGIAPKYHVKAAISDSIMNNLDKPQAAKSVMKSVANAHEEYKLARSVTVRQVHEKLDAIESRKPLYSPLFSAFGSAVACAAFVFLLGGGFYDIIGAFVGAGIGHYVRRLMFAKRLNQFFVTFISVAIAALVCTGVLRLIGLYDLVALEHDTAYIGAMLFVVPGFPLVTGGLDIAKLDFQSGIQRLFYTLSIILMATFGAWMVAVMVHLNPQGFATYHLEPGVLLVLRAIASFLGVWGFSVLFNSPQRMCFVAGIIGAITNTLRLTLTDFNISPEIAAFVGALLAGLLATAWRRLVHYGKLPTFLGYPRICLTIPSIVIMVPGMYMYRSMFNLGQYEILESLHWGIQAFMVIICLPIGLAFARVLTDKNWRYDV